MTAPACQHQGVAIGDYCPRCGTTPHVNDFWCDVWHHDMHVIRQWSRRAWVPSVDLKIALRRMADWAERNLP